MFYVKNVPNWERILRIIMGAMLAMTGLFGFYPMCTMIGRELDKRH